MSEHEGVYGSQSLEKTQQETAEVVTPAPSQDPTEGVALDDAAAAAEHWDDRRWGRLS